MSISSALSLLMLAAHLHFLLVGWLLLQKGGSLMLTQLVGLCLAIMCWQCHVSACTEQSGRCAVHMGLVMLVL